VGQKVFERAYVTVVAICLGVRSLRMQGRGAGAMRSKVGL